MGTTDQCFLFVRGLSCMPDVFLVGETVRVMLSKLYVCSFNYCVLHQIFRFDFLAGQFIPAGIIMGVQQIVSQMT